MSDDITRINELVEWFRIYKKVKGLSNIRIGKLVKKGKNFIHDVVVGLVGLDAMIKLQDEIIPIYGDMDISNYQGYDKKLCVNGFSNLKRMLRRHINNFPNY